MACSGGRFVQSRGSRGCNQSCPLFSLSFFFAPPPALPPWNFLPAAAWASNSEAVRTVGAAGLTTHGRASPVQPRRLPQFGNMAAPLPAWLGVRETFQVDASLKADTSLYPLHYGMRKGGHSWHLGCDFPGRRAERSL